MVLKNSLVPLGPVTRTLTSPMFGWAVNSNVKKGQHSRSARINSHTSTISSLSPRMRNAYPSGSSSVESTADFLPRPKTFDRLKVIEPRNRQGYTYRFEGPPQPWPANRIDGAFRIYFITDENMLLVVEAKKRLAETLKEMLRSEHK
jgi:hypothetical protein